MFEQAARYFDSQTWGHALVDGVARFDVAEDAKLVRRQSDSAPVDVSTTEDRRNTPGVTADGREAPCRIGLREDVRRMSNADAAEDRNHEGRIARWEAGNLARALTHPAIEQSRS
jgi:hypothetical protein